MKILFYHQWDWYLIPAIVVMPPMGSGWDIGLGWGICFMFLCWSLDIEVGRR